TSPPSCSSLGSPPGVPCGPHDRDSEDAERGELTGSPELLAARLPPGPESRRDAISSAACDEWSAAGGGGCSPARPRDAQHSAFRRRRARTTEPPLGRWVLSRGGG